jgi:hypothetical protein
MEYAKHLQIKRIRLNRIRIFYSDIYIWIFGRVRGGEVWHKPLLFPMKNPPCSPFYIFKEHFEKGAISAVNTKSNVISNYLKDFPLEAIEKIILCNHNRLRE